MRSLGFILFVSLCLTLSAQTTPAEAPLLTRVLLIYDCSNSMNGRWQSDSKISISKRLLSGILDSISEIPNLELALRVYGHQSDYPPINCKDTRLEVPFAKHNASRIIQKIKGLVPRGGTPIAYSLQMAAEDFPPCDRCRNVIILITDGLEECDGDICAASAYLQSKGISLKPFIIGIGQDFSEGFGCVGRYFDASQETEFVNAFNVVISMVMENTTAQVNLMDEWGNPSESNITMTFYDHYSGQVKYNYVHAMNARGVADTVTLDPLATYKLLIQSIPPVERDSIVLVPGKHNIIAMDVPQGQLKLSMPGTLSNAMRHTPCLIYREGEKEILHVQYLNTQSRYLCGHYDLEFLTMPRLKIPSVKIEQSQISQVEIPMPGIAVIQRTIESYGALFIEDGNTMQLVCNLNENERQETYYLQPGRYRVVLRSKFFNRSAATLETRFTVESGKTVSVKL